MEYSYLDVQHLLAEEDEPAVPAVADEDVPDIVGQEPGRPADLACLVAVVAALSGLFGLQIDVEHVVGAMIREEDLVVDSSQELDAGRDFVVSKDNFS